MISHRYEWHLLRKLKTTATSAQTLRDEYYDTLLKALLDRVSEADGLCPVVMSILDLEKSYGSKPKAMRHRAVTLVVEETRNQRLSDEDIFGTRTDTGPHAKSRG